MECGDGVVEGRNVADVRPQPSVTHPLHDSPELGAIGLDNEVDRQAIGGPHFWRSDDGNQRSSRSKKSRRPLPDIAADEIEHQLDPANAFEHVVVEIDQLLRPKLERLVPVDSASGAEYVSTGLARKSGAMGERGAVRVERG